MRHTSLPRARVVRGDGGAGGGPGAAAAGADRAPAGGGAAVPVLEAEKSDYSAARSFRRELNIHALTFKFKIVFFPPLDCLILKISRRSSFPAIIDAIDIQNVRLKQSDRRHNAHCDRRSHPP